MKIARIISTRTLIAFYLCDSIKVRDAQPCSGGLLGSTFHGRSSWPAWFLSPLPSCPPTNLPPLGRGRLAGSRPFLRVGQRCDLLGSSCSWSIAQVFQSPESLWSIATSTATGIGRDCLIGSHWYATASCLQLSHHVVLHHGCLVVQGVVSVQDPRETKALPLNTLLSLAAGASIFGHVATEPTRSAVNLCQTASALPTPVSPWQCDEMQSLPSQLTLTFGCASSRSFCAPCSDPTPAVPSPSSTWPLSLLCSQTSLRGWGLCRCRGGRRTASR